MIVVIPYCTKDWQVAVRLINWMVDLDGCKTMPDCMLMSSFPCTKEQNDSVIAAAINAFLNVSMIRQNVAEESGWPMSPNALFLLVADEMRKHGQPWLWLEPDATPTQKGWFQKIINGFDGKRFMGATVKEPTPHLNGVAVYPPDIFRFVPREAFKNRGIPFDVAMGKWVMPLATNSTLFQHEWSPFGIMDASNPPRSFPRLEDLEVLRNDAVIFHRCKDGSLIERLKERSPAKQAMVRGKGHIIPKRHREQDAIITPTVIHTFERHIGESVRNLRAMESWQTIWSKHGWKPSVFDEPYLRDARSIGDRLALPFIKDMISAAMKLAKSDSDIVLLTNSDIILLDGFHDELLEAMKETPVWVSSRRDIEPGQPAVKGVPLLTRHMNCGRDVAAFRVWWLKKHWQEIPDMILSACDWDVFMTLISRRTCKYNINAEWCFDVAFTITPPSEAASPNVLHERHESRWMVEAVNPSTLHNGREFLRWRNKYAPDVLLPWIEKREKNNPEFMTKDTRPKLAVMGLVSGFPGTLPGLLESLNPMLNGFSVYSFAACNDQRSNNTLSAWGATIVPDPLTLPSNRYSRMSTLHNGVWDALDASGFNPDYILWIDMDVKAMTRWDGIPRLLQGDWDAVSVLGIMPADMVKPWHAGPYFMHEGREVVYYDTLAFEDADGFRYLFGKDGQWYSHGDVPCGTMFKWGSPCLVSGDWTPVRSAFGPATFYRASSIKGMRYNQEVKEIHHNDFHARCRSRNKIWKHFIANDIVFDYA